MKSIRSFREKAKSSTIGPGILVLALVMLLCLPNMISATTHGSAGNIGWYSAMAMGNLAEQKNVKETQKIAREKDSTIAAVVTVAEDTRAEGTNSDEKDTAEK